MLALLAAFAGAGVLVAGLSSGEPGAVTAPAAGAGARPGPGALPERRCDTTVDEGGDLDGAVESADPGQRVCLASGDFGIFHGAAKDGTVVVQPAPGAEPRLALDFAGATGIHVDGVTITEASIHGPSRDITVSNSTFTGIAVIEADEMTDAHIRFEANRHAGIDTCVTCYQGRVHVQGGSGSPAGVVIADSLFSGGNSDGVRADADGVAIVRNEFTKLRDQDPFHTDPIQIYGGKNVVIRDNYIHDNAVSAGIMMADGGRGNLVEGNVIAGTGITWAMTWYADRDSVIRNNTFADGRCQFNQRCGVINLGAKAGDPPGRGTVIRDNVLGGVSNGGGDQDSAFSADHNLTRDPLPGTGNVQGLPDYRGPLGTRPGHRLAPGSPGAHAASDGRNPGVR